MRKRCLLAIFTQPPRDTCNVRCSARSQVKSGHALAGRQPLGRPQCHGFDNEHSKPLLERGMHGARAPE